MMMLSNSKPRAVETSRSQPEGGVYPLSRSGGERRGFVPLFMRISPEIIPLRPEARHRIILGGSVCPFSTYSCDSKHIAQTLSTRVSPIRF